MIPAPFRADESTGLYVADKPVNAASILKMANYLAKQRLKKGTELSNPHQTYAYLQPLLQELEHEVFGVILMDQQHRIIRYEPLFRGTINQAQVYPREIVKLALSVNAAAVILFHNHPSGKPTPSESDKSITQTIKQALSLVDVLVIDHVIVGKEGFVSLAQLGDV